MKFRNYCAIIMGDTRGAEAEIIKIAETEPNILDAKGIIIATFSSVAEPRELTEYFKEHNRNFLLFDMNPDFSGYQFLKKEINNGLFGFLANMNEDSLNKKTNDLINEISSSTVTQSIIENTADEEHITLADIEKMSVNEKNNLMNKLLRKDGKNLSEYDKEILGKLSI